MFMEPVIEGPYIRLDTGEATIMVDRGWHTGDCCPHFYHFLTEKDLEARQQKQERPEVRPEQKEMRTVRSPAHADQEQS
jgi:hypothetical protein